MDDGFVKAIHAAVITVFVGSAAWVGTSLNGLSRDMSSVQTSIDFLRSDISVFKYDTKITLDRKYDRLEADKDKELILSQVEQLKDSKNRRR